jgi:UDP-N-acetylmuramate--alanine ligase
MDKDIIDWNTIHTVHFVGIKGVAMTSLALYCLEKGMTVTGSDVKDDFPTKDVLSSAPIAIKEGFSKKHITEFTQVPDCVIYTGAHGGAENIEVVTAKSAGIPVIPHGKALGMLMKGSVQVSVAGCHGKTTTSAMIATILTSARLDPSFAIGCGSVNPIGNPGHFGTGTMFVAEADEYLTDPLSDRTPRFYWQTPDIFVVTNIDFDHPDAYGSIEDVKKAFLKVQDQEKGQACTIVNADDPHCEILRHPSKGFFVTYGTSQHADYRISDISMKDGRTVFSLFYSHEPMGTFSVAVPGIHNALNAAAAIACCRQLSVSFEEIRKGLATFSGTKRRFEVIGEKNKIAVIDDYAHHPAEITATLAAAKSRYPGQRIIIVFQPHTYSRTRALLSEFVHAFTQADIVLISQIYASARESVDPTMTAELFVNEMKAFQKNVYFEKSYSDTERYLDTIVKAKDIIIFAGAGDIADWGVSYFDHMRNSL